jgi:hypothetical protein
MNYQLDKNNDLFRKLRENPPIWWKHLIQDKERYIEIRKDNSINIYYNGGSIMKLEWKGTV